jgi:hypothetical protein
MIIGKSGCAGSTRRNQRDRIGPIAVCSAWVCIGWGSRDLPFLKVGAAGLILNCNSFSLLKKSQKNIHINVIISQVADVDACSTDLRGIVPKKIAIAWIARCSSRVSPVEEQV